MCYLSWVSKNVLIRDFLTQTDSGIMMEMQATYKLHDLHTDKLIGVKLGVNTRRMTWSIELQLDSGEWLTHWRPLLTSVIISEEDSAPKTESPPDYGIDVTYFDDHIWFATYAMGDCVSRIGFTSSTFRSTFRKLRAHLDELHCQNGISSYSHRGT